MISNAAFGKVAVKVERLEIEARDFVQQPTLAAGTDEIGLVEEAFRELTRDQRRSYCRIRGLATEYRTSVRKLTATYVSPMARMQP